MSGDKFGSMTEELQTNYLHKYVGVQAQIHQASQFDDFSAVHTSYFGKTDKTKKNVIKAQEQFSITDHSTTVDTLLYVTECQIHLDRGATKSFMSKQCYLRNKSLYGLPKFSSKAKVIQVGNGEGVNILFIIPIIITVQGHIF